MNPFQLVFDGLWDMVEDNKELMSLVKPRNRIKFDTTSGPKKSIINADAPELMLFQDSIAAQLQSSSSSTEITRFYSWQLTTGDWQIQETFNTVLWELLRSMSSWQTLCELQFNGYNFVKYTNVTTGRDGFTQRQANRGLAGWAAIWEAEVRMHIKTSDLRITS